MKRKFLFAGIVFALCALGIGTYWYSIYRSEGNVVHKSQPTATVAGHTIKVMIANTPVLRERGLGGREKLADDEGMLFLFDSDSRYAFWMKDMRFSIDIIWISAQGEVVDMRENVSPSTYPEIFEPILPARDVLELTAGSVKRLNLHRGDIVRR